MAGITIRVLDGSDRGRAFEDLRPPVSIGREEGNVIQLNDERVSRFHVKIQEDRDKLVLTDLESTNGTKVNGEPVKLRILRYGDMVTLGRSVLLFGSREQISERLRELRKNNPGLHEKLDADDFNAERVEDSDFQSLIHDLEPPELPERLSPGQAAQLSELLEFLHVGIRRVMESVEFDSKSHRVTIDLNRWHHLLDLQSRVAEYMRKIGDPS